MNTFKVKYIGESDPFYLIEGNVYDVIGEEKEYYRIVDESGDDYLYSKDNFEIIKDGPECVNKVLYYM